MKTQPRKQTKASSVYEQLRNDILHGFFKPDEKLQMDALKDRYGVGYSPLREALTRLTSRGLVKQEDQCGFAVMTISTHELQDLYQVRAAIEKIGLEQAIALGDDSWEAGIIASWHCFAKYIDPNTAHTVSTEEWERLQKIFFLSIVKGCQSPWLLHIYELLYDQSARYRYLCLRDYIKNKKLRAVFIHGTDKFVKSLLARDKDKAVKLSQSGWNEAVKSIKKNMPNNQ